MTDIREIVVRSYGTDLHPVALGATLLMGIWLLRSPRSQAVLPLTLVACLIPLTQRLVLGGLDFSMIRVLIVFGWIRILSRGELRGFRAIPLDYALCTWLALGTLMYTLREGNVGALVYRLGFAFDAVGVYFLFRCLIRGPRDIAQSIRIFAWITIVIAVFMTIEWLTQRNLFAVFGGVREITWVRDGRLRCQGAFSHPIMAGTFGATMAALFVGLWPKPAQPRGLLAVAFAGATAIVFYSSSSGAALAYLALLAGWGLWYYRQHMRIFVWGALAMAIVLHFVREKPIWHLISRAAELVGGTGYHRYKLIDAWVNRFSEWWLLGSNNMANWGWGLQDVTNQYVLESVRGGLVTVLCFLVVLGLAFRTVGDTVRRAEGARLPKSRIRTQQLLAWSLGVSLAVHCVSFISVSYFGQMQILLYLLFALIASLHPQAHRRAARAPAPARTPRPAASSSPAPAGAGAGATASASLGGLLK